MVFAEVDLHLYRDHDADDYVRWRAEVGFLHPRDAEFYLIFGQIGFYDEYNVTTNRRLLTVRVQHVETLTVADLR